MLMSLLISVLFPKIILKTCEELVLVVVILTATQK